MGRGGIIAALRKTRVRRKGASCNRGSVCAVWYRQGGSEGGRRGTERCKARRRLLGACVQSAPRSHGGVAH